MRKILLPVILATALLGSCATDRDGSASRPNVLSGLFGFVPRSASSQIRVPGTTDALTSASLSGVSSELAYTGSGAVDATSGASAHAGPTTPAAPPTVVDVTTSASLAGGKPASGGQPVVAASSRHDDERRGEKEKDDDD